MNILFKFLPFFLPILGIIVILLSGYVKAPPDQAYIVSGLKKKPKILVGQAGIKIPFIERLDKVYLGQMSVDIKTEQPVPTNDFINVNVDAVAKIRILDTPEGIKLASRNFLNKRPVEITDDLTDSLQGNMREIIGTLSLKEINTDRDSFSDQVVEKAAPDMAKLGIEILSCNIQNVTDENGLIKDLGADNTSLIKRNAAIAKAEADKDVAIAQAEADKKANDARIISETEIAQRNNELAIKKAELKIEADTTQANADAAYEIQKQEQLKKIETTTIDAQIAKTERSAELKKLEVIVTKEQLDAEVRAKADAERYKAEQVAQADLFKRQKEAEAELFEEETKAKAEIAKSDAERHSKEQQAIGIKSLGLAEAEAIKAKALAEAEGINKKAEAMQKFGEAAIVEMLVKAMPEIAKNVAEPLSKVDKITMYGEGNNTKLIKDIVNGTNQITEGMFEGLGLDLKGLLAGFVGGKAAGIPEIKVNNQDCATPVCTEINIKNKPKVNDITPNKINKEELD